MRRVLRERPNGAAPAGMGALTTFLVALLATGLPVLLHPASVVAALAACFAIAVILLYASPQAIPAALITAYLFQNLFVALVSPSLAGTDDLNTIRAYNFLLSALVWVGLSAAYWTRRGEYPPQVRKVMLATTLGLVVIVGYFALGATKNVSSALAYLRNILAPIMLIQCCLLVASTRRVAIVEQVSIIVAALLCWGYAELILRETLLELVNGDVYISLRIKQDIESGVWLRDMQQTGRVMRSYLDSLVIDFLNTPLLQIPGFRLYRLVGPNFHSISFAYALAGLSLFLAAAGRWSFALLSLPLLLVVGSKGALVLLLFVSGAMLFVSLGLRTLYAYAAALCVYASAGIAAGLRTQDYHVIGFVGGLRGFLSNPLGHGLGAGGNLSVNVSALNWSVLQQTGHTDVAVESAIGVILYQMGIGGVLIVLLLCWVGVRLWMIYRRTLAREYAFLALAVLVTTVNGIFQEEALFAPLAMGMLMALAGILLGQSWQLSQTPATAPRSRAPLPHRLAPAGFTTSPHSPSQTA